MDASTGEGIGLTCVRSAVRLLGYRPYLCQVGRTTTGAPIPASDQLTVLGRPRARDVARADPAEQELGNWDVARVDPTEQELGNYDVARVDLIEQELGNCDVARVDPTEQELGNYDVARVDPIEQELGNCDVARVDPTEQELGNWDVARVDLTEQELGNYDSNFRQGRTWAQILGFGREGGLGHKSEDLTERVSSGANLRIWPRGWTRAQI
ncbi:hypothetical protein B296_00009413 [Ensete ventricosum]|uniref:Uncharacterized protein n=1 Tax=Ensete ventricosum TaxID=4639 RepID=A0A427ADM7_ENSVE|nr:hypothetical protein B296_00009413 [Ensete ventricosum]